MEKQKRFSIQNQKQFSNYNKIPVGYMLIILMFVMVNFILLISFDNVVNDFTFLVEHDQPVLLKASTLQKLVIDMETGERGFLITGVDEFLEPYHYSIQDFDTIAAEIRFLVSDNPSQADALDQIIANRDKWLMVAGQPEIEARREMNQNQTSIDDVVALIQGGTGKRILDTMRGQFETFIQVENDLNANRVNIVYEDTNTLKILIIAVTVAGLVIGFGIALGSLWIPRRS